MDVIQNSFRNKVIRLLLVFVLVVGLTPLTAFAGASENGNDIGDSDAGYEQQEITMSIEEYEAAKAASDTKQNKVEDAVVSNDATTVDNSNSSTTTTDDAVVESEEEETYPLTFMLEDGSLQTGDNAVNVLLEKKADNEWTKVKEFKLIAGKAIEIGELEKDVYRVVLADEVYTHLDGTKSVLADEMTLVTTASNKIKADKGFEFNPAVETTLKIGLVEAPADEADGSSAENGDNSSTEEGKEDDSDDGDGSELNIVEADVVVEPNIASDIARFGTLMAEGSGEFPEDVQEMETITFYFIGEATVEVDYEGCDSQFIEDGDSITLPKYTYAHVKIHNPNDEYIEVRYGDPSSGAEIEGLRTVVESSDFVTDITASQSWDIIVNLEPCSNSSEEEASTFSWDQPYNGETFSGSCHVTWIDGGGGHTVHGLGIRFDDGILAGVNASGGCAHHSAAAPDVGQGYWYTYTVTSIDYASGTVTGSAYCTSKEDPTDGHTSNGAGLIGYQGMSASGIKIHRDYGGYAKVKKSSSCTNVSEGNSNYSLAGAVYGVYRNMSCTDLVTTLTTDENGDTPTTGWLDHGTYYLKEISAPKGFELNTTTYRFTVSGGTAVVNVEDRPLNDPSQMWVGKTDAETTLNMPQGSASLAGAEFTVKYYEDITIATFEEAQALTPTRTWVVKTNENGYAELADSLKVSGDEFYYSPEGNVTIPLGTVTVQETKAPEGYLLNEEAKYIQHVTADGMLGDSVDVYNAPEVPEQIKRGGISVTKSLEGGENEELEGIGFYLVSKTTGERVSWLDENGQTVDELYLDRNGFATTPADALVYDTYQIIEDEATVPEDIMWYGNTQTTFTQVVGEQTVAEDNVIYNQEVTNYEKIDLDLIKIDGDSLRDNGDDEQAADRVEGSEWQLTYGDEVVFTGTTDENGILDFPRGAIDRFGTYTLTEIKAANEDAEDGYMSADASGMPESVSFTIDADTYTKMANGTYEGVAGDSWEFKMVDGKAAIVKTTQNFKYRFIEAVKTDQDTDEPIPNTRYQLYQYIGDEADYEDNAGIDRELTHDTYLTDPAEAIDTSLWQLVAEGVTDENGSFITKGLEMHHYMLIEVQPNIDYAEWWESGDSTWDRYYFTTDQENPQSQTQIFRNDKIELECDVDKSTIQRTSASFNSLPGQNVNYQNVGIEEYRYDVGFSNGETNHRADQYTVIDNCEFTSLGIRLSKFWTPVVQNDTDGVYNIWVKTAKGVTGGSASATATNPENLNADGSNRISTEGCLLWAENVDCTTRQQLDVADLGLDEDDYVTEIMLEFGSVEVEFGTTTPMSYLVVSTYQLPADTVIPNSAESHITRNWNGGVDGQGLYDDATDKVETRVIDTMKYDSHTDDWYGTSGYVFGKSMPKTGDEFPVWAFGLALAGALAAAGVGIVLRRRAKHAA